GGKWASAAAAAEEHQRSGGRRYDGWENVDQEEENHDDEGWLARKTRAVQNDSVNTTRRALQKAREADEIADRSLNKLNEQSEQLHRIEHRLDTADSHAKISEAKTAELKALNRWFFLPTFGASKKAKAQEDRLKEEMAEAERRDAERRENVRNGGGYYSGSSSARDLSMRETGRDRSRNGNGRDHRGGGGGGGDGYGYSKSYSTPEGLDRDEMEDEIDNNLDEMSDMLRKLRMKGQIMGQEIESQTSHIRNINDKTDM
ncbi:Protein transport protein S9 plasma membrane t-SNARE, partial [Rhizoclosmatium hyalinum]